MIFFHQAQIEHIPEFIVLLDTKITDNFIVYTNRCAQRHFTVKATCDASLDDISGPFTLNAF